MVTSERLCIGCQQRESRDSLLRFVLAGDPPSVVPDVRRRDGGRGASTHARFTCVSNAVRNGGFQRAFKRKLQLSAPELAEWARGQYERRIDGLLSTASRVPGALALGGEAAREQLRTSAPALLVVADDAAGRRDELREAAERLGGRCAVFGDKQHLGALFGRAELGVIAVLDTGIAKAIREAARCTADLAEEA